MIEKYFGYIGYEPLLEEAFNHFKRGRHVIFTGDDGCGKTSLIHSCAEMMAERKMQSMPMVIETCTPPKQFAMEIVHKLYNRKMIDRDTIKAILKTQTAPIEYTDELWEKIKSRLNREHIQNCTRIILTTFQKFPGVFIGIDRLEDLTPSGRSLVLGIIHSGAIVCGAAGKKTAAVKKLIYHFQEIRVPPMPDKDVRRIVEAFVDEGRLVEDRKHFVENIIWKASGNVLALDNLLRYFANEPHIRIDEVRQVKQGSARKEVSIEWIIYAGFAFIVMLRFVSRATMNRQLYIITSVIAALFIVMRYMMMKGNRKETA